MSLKLFSKEQILKEKLIGMNRWKLDYLVRIRKIPIVKIGKRIYFNPEAIDKWILNNSLGAMEITNNEK